MSSSKPKPSKESQYDRRMVKYLETLRQRSDSRWDPWMRVVTITEILNISDPIWRAHVKASFPELFEKNSQPS
jgi:hypothetical protein